MGIYKDRVANGFCGRCGKIPIQLPQKQCDVCKKKCSTQQKEIRLNRIQNNLCSTCGKRKPSLNMVHCEFCRTATSNWDKKQNRENNRLRTKRSSDKLRNEVVAAYGGKCNCCGVTESVWLTVDHIDGKGADHRRALTGKNLGAGSQNIYRWLRKNGFPAGFQILCWNCNWAKSHGGCPHKKL